MAATEMSKPQSHGATEKQENRIVHYQHKLAVESCWNSVDDMAGFLLAVSDGDIVVITCRDFVERLYARCTSGDVMVRQDLQKLAEGMHLIMIDWSQHHVELTAAGQAWLEAILSPHAPGSDDTLELTPDAQKLVDHLAPAPAPATSGCGAAYIKKQLYTVETGISDKGARVTDQRGGVIWYGGHLPEVSRHAGRACEVTFDPDAPSTAQIEIQTDNGALAIPGVPITDEKYLAEIDANWRQQQIERETNHSAA